MSLGAHLPEGRAAIAAAAIVLVTADAIFAITPTAAAALAAVAVTTVVLVIDSVRALRARRAPRFLAALVAVLVFFAAMRGYAFVLQLTSLAPARAAAVTYDVVWLGVAGSVATVLWAEPRVAQLLRAVWSRPRRVLSGSFALLILVTSVLLTLPISVRDVGTVSILDALFTATSAVCVTGLTVNDVAATYTPFGQGVILLAIQLGGVGIMTIAAFAVTAVRNAMSRESHMARILDTENLADLRRMVRGVVLGTVVFESIGAALLWFLWAPRAGLAGLAGPTASATDGASVLWLAVFHAVSAFCNAGFSLFSDSLARFSNDAPTQLVIMALVFIGGLGFPVWHGLGAHGARRVWHLVKKGAPRPLHLDLGTRVALAVSAALVAAGTVAFLALEWNGALASVSLPARALNALFCSVVTRTAGFTTVGFEHMGDAALLVAMALMFVGASPGSTGGGIKTTTAAVIAAAVRAELRGQEARLFGRALDAALLRRAVAVLILGAALVLAALFALTLTEEQPLRRLAFEAVSAFSTTGLSTGLTPLLSPAGKVIIILTMFAGRVGPLTLALALGMERRRALHRLPSETLPVG